MPGGAIAKLHSLVASNSLVCRSFMMERTSTADCSPVSARSDCGRISPSILIAGGKPAVMNRSEAFLLDDATQKVLHELDALFAIHVTDPARQLRLQRRPCSVAL